MLLFCNQARFLTQVNTPSLEKPFDQGKTNRTSSDVVLRVRLPLDNASLSLWHFQCELTTIRQGIDKLSLRINKNGAVGIQTPFVLVRQNKVSLLIGGSSDLRSDLNTLHSSFLLDHLKKSNSKKYSNSISNNMSDSE